MESLIALTLIVFVFWYSLPGYATPLSRALLVLSTLFLPVVGWAWTLWHGHEARRELAAAREVAGKIEHYWAHQRAVEFWRETLTSGTPVERMTAAALLDYWGEPEQAAPAEIVNGNTGGILYIPGELLATQEAELRRAFDGFVTHVEPYEVVERNADGSICAARRVPMVPRDPDAPTDFDG